MVANVVSYFTMEQLFGWMKNHVHRIGAFRRMGRIGSLLATMVKIGLIGFGGGNALVPVIERELVSSSDILTKEEFDKEVIVANITPGALPIEIASGAGRVIAGIPGMVLAAVGMAIPGALLTFILLVLFSTAADSIITQLRFASVGVAMLIVVLLVNYTVQTIKSKPAHSYQRMVAVILIVAVFALTCGKKLCTLFGISSKGVLTLSTLDVLGVVFFAIFFTGGRFMRSKAETIRTIFAGVIGLLYLLSSNAVGPFGEPFVKPALQVIMIALGVWGFVRSFMKKHGPITKFPVKRMTFEILTWVAFIVVLVTPALITCPEALQFAGNAILSVLMSFGGGDAYLVFGQGVFVDTGMIPHDQYFEQVVTVSNAMPGSIIAKVLTGVGFFIGAKYGAAAAVFTAIAGFGCGVGASGLTFLVIYYVYERFEPLEIFQAIKRYIRSVIGGLLLTIAVTMFSLNMDVASSFELSPAFMVVFSLALLAALLWLNSKRSLPLATLIVIAVLAAMAACNVVYFVL